eukprot:GHVL01008381.1.p1 GENE.GHVL01008381.1~~GHVL01008381.1.p1  ORF type:complete len:238 (-),score=30.38 GHVL01008381.1:331-1044(-)
MEITPVDLEQLKQTVPAPVKKRRGRPKKTATVADPVGAVEDEEMEMKKLKEQLLNYADHNPDVVMKPVNDKIAKLVNEMSIDELRARCRQGKKINAGRMDNVVGQQIIQLSNMAVGQMLDCLDELDESTRDDKLLNEVTTEYMSLHLLDFIPEEIKIAGIYSSHVLSAYREKQRKQPKTVKKLPVIEMNVDVPSEVSEVVEVKEEVKLAKKDVDNYIPRVQEVRDKLIRFRGELDGN